MGVLSKISVGDIFYYSVDDIPSHTAPKGSVAIISVERSVYNNGFTYINNNGGNVWLKCIESKYGEITLNNGTTTIAATAGVAWNAFNPTDTWTLNPDSHIDFILSTKNTTTDDLEYTGATTMRAICRQNSTIRSASRFIEFETGVAYNFTVPPSYNANYAPAGATLTTTQGSQGILQFDTNDYILGGVSTPVLGGNNAGQRTWLPKYCQISATKIDEPLVIPGAVSTGTTVIDETFESSGFTSNSWTVVNDTTNVWVVGQAENNGGTSSAYVSNDGGTSASYSINVNDVSHFYKDFVLPTSTGLTLTFDWKCQGENAAGATQYDYGAVVITDTTTTPAAASEVITTQAGSGTNGRLGAVANLGKFNLNYGTTPGTTWNTETIDLSSYGGSTKRIVFTWKDDTSVGVMPPFVVDNIKISVGGGTAPDTLVY